LENYQTYYDIRFPGDERAAGRPLRRSPAYGWHEAADAAFGEKSGWERVNFYRSNEASGDRALRPNGWAGKNFSPAIAAEHDATRKRVALFDESSFAKIRVAGPDSAPFLQWVCDNDDARGVGRVTYTQMLNSRGGIEADVTVTRVAPSAFWLVTGTAFGSRDGAWLRRQARAGRCEVDIADITGQYACFALWGPRSRELLQALTPADLGHRSFGFMTSQEMSVGDVPVRVDGAVVGRVTSGGFGYTVRKSIAYGYLPVDRAAIGTEVAVDIFGEWVPGRVAQDQLHDPRGDSIRS
jgi:4-methylaminobutanoate oxidase (formaldehyde-forming)